MSSMHAQLETWRPGVDGPWNRSAAAHLLVRAGFGPEPGELERAVDAGPDAVLDELFAATTHDPHLMEGVRSVLPTGNVEALQAWWMALILSGRAPLVERVTLMWHRHFATSHDKVRDVRLMHRQNQTLRELGLGDFRELLHAMATDPAMLVWLDGNDNRRGHPNENFAREVMELFALGIGNYTEDDVLEAARAFTGWGTEGRSFVFRSDHHDDGIKTVFGRRGRFTGEEMIDRVLEHPACPRFVARRLCSSFVAPDVPEDVVEALGRELVARDWNVGETLRSLLRSRLFFAPAMRRSRIAGPVELIAMGARALDARVAPGKAARAATRMGQSLFRPPSVKGWDGGRAWINAGTWLARHNALTGLAHGDGATLDLRQRFADPASTDTVPGRVVRELLFDADAVSGEYVDVLERAADRSDSVDEALAQVTALVLTSPEYHLV